MLFGPVLHAIIEWLTISSESNGVMNEELNAFRQLFQEDIPVPGASPTVSKEDNSNSYNAMSVVNGLSNLFKESLGLSAPVANGSNGVPATVMPSMHKISTATSGNKHEIIHGAGVAALHTVHDAPSSRCSGIILHVFMNGPQIKLSDKITHPSIRIHSREPNRTCYSVKWAKVRICFVIFPLPKITLIFYDLYRNWVITAMIIIFALIYIQASPAR